MCLVGSLLFYVLHFSLIIFSYLLFFNSSFLIFSILFSLSLIVIHNTSSPLHGFICGLYFRDSQILLSLFFLSSARKKFFSFLSAVLSLLHQAPAIQL